MNNRKGFYLGLAIIALVTLALEVSNARLFSVISWYHLSFVAISIAMLGMTAGAVYVYVRPARFSGDLAAPLGLYSFLFAVTIPIGHVIMIQLRPGVELSLRDVSGFMQLAIMAIVASVPFFLSGVVIAISLTKAPLPIGRIYFFDLLGAGVGCVAAIGLLETTDPSSGSFFLATMACVGSVAYLCISRQRSNYRWQAVVLACAVGFAALGWQNHSAYPNGIRLTHSKGIDLPEDPICDRWNTHSRIIAYPLVEQPVRYWGPGRGAPKPLTRWSVMRIDGKAGTTVHEWKGDIDELEWIKHDVTSLAYNLRGRGDVAVIGVGGGRDILTGLAFGAKSILGVELNDIFLDLLRGEFRAFSPLVERPEVTLVHDDGRSFLARYPKKLDLIQMSLIDTWASTSAGAMTLSENGLYTVEAWKTFIDRLKPDGVFTVSRWFSPNELGETARLVSLAATTLFEMGVDRPSDHMVLAAAGKVATIIVSPTPLTPEAVATISNAVKRYGFSLILRPGATIDDPRFKQILNATTVEQLNRGLYDPVLDLRAPYDERPFFFNIIRPAAWMKARASAPKGKKEGVIAGNLVATDNLVAILIIVTILVGLSVVAPLLAFGGRHGLGVVGFSASAFYFAMIGLGFMLVEIALMQRFSVLMGHPVWALAIVLFSMILCTGVGSAISDSLPLSGGRVFGVPLIITLVIAAAAYGAQFAINGAMSDSFATRAVVTLLFTVPIGLALGFCFPVGMRLVSARSTDAMPWMWGINGGFGVLGGVIAVIISMTLGITWSMIIGGFCYLSLLLPIGILRVPAASR